MWALTIPLEVPSQNQTERGRCHFARARRTKHTRAAWACCCRSEMARLGIPVATGKRSLRVLAYRKRLCLDIANLIGGFKACADGLVDAGLLQDDRNTKALITYDQSLASWSPLGPGVPCAVIDVSDLTS